MLRGKLFVMYFINQKKLYKSSNLFWSVSGRAITFGRINDEDVLGPYCINCYADLIVPKEAYDMDLAQNSKWSITLTCMNCGKDHKIKDCIQLLKEYFMLEFTSRQRSQLEKESLDDAPSSLKVKDEDDKYFLSAKIGEKDGKRIGVVYFGEKGKEQKKIDYSQIFVDLDDNQVRFDKSNKFPGKLLARMFVEFDGTKHEDIYKTKRKSE